MTIWGCANIIAAIVSPWWVGPSDGVMWSGPSDAVIPGVVLGAVLAVIGIKGGLPLIPTSGPESISLGLRKIRRRRLATYLCAIPWMLFAALIMTSVPRSSRVTIFFMLTMIPIGFFTLWSLSACPRCGQHFLVGKLTRRWSWSMSSHCQNCGLGLK